MFARLAIGATVRVEGRGPKGARPGLADGARRMAGADARPRPPLHWHVGAIDGIEPAFWTSPIDAVGAARSEGEGGGRDALAAPLPDSRLRKMRRLFRSRGRLRRVTTANALVLSEFAPECASPAIGRPRRMVGHGSAFDTSLTSCKGVGVKLVGCGGGGGVTVHPPPRASIRPMSESSSARVQDDRQALGFQRGALRGHHVQERRRLRRDRASSRGRPPCGPPRRQSRSADTRPPASAMR